MPFISRGVTVSFVRADEKPLAVILDELRRKKFTGRIEFNVVCDGTSYNGAIELLEGNVVAAELTYPAFIRGAEALQRILNRWVMNCRGYAEIIELDKDKVNIDLGENPTAKIDPKHAESMITEALNAIKMLTEAKPETPPEEVAPTAPLVMPPEEEKPPEAATAVEEKPAEERVIAATAEEKPPEATPVAEAIASSEEIIERLDSPLFDASIVLRGTLVDSGYVEPSKINELIEKIRKISLEHRDKAIVAFVNDRMNELKGKIVAHDGIIVATLVKRDSQRLLDTDALNAMASFPRPLLYDIYLVGEDVDETLYKLAQKAVQEAREAARKQAEQKPAEAEERKTEEAAEREEHREGERRRRRFFIFFRR